MATHSSRSQARERQVPTDTASQWHWFILASSHTLFCHIVELLACFGQLVPNVIEIP